MAQHSDDSTDNLSDAQLLARESMQHREYSRLEARDPRFRDTTYGVVRGSKALIDAWERWWKTNLAARARGILKRV